MSMRDLPAVQAFARPEGMSWDAPADAMARWSPQVRAAASDDAATINIFDLIGEDPWSGAGWTAKRVAGVLRAVGERDVTVAINSPGGDVFEGIAIYNLLREHKATVTVRVMGLAASAASLIAMAGDQISIGNGAMMMIHNSWGVALGNRHDMRGAADVLEAIDDAMAGLYAGRTGQDKKAVAKMLDAETWLSAAQAMEQGFADATFDESAQGASALLPQQQQARHQLDVVLAKAGMPRSERRRLMRDIYQDGTPSAAGPPATQNAGHDTGVSAELRRLISNLKV